MQRSKRRRRDRKPGPGRKAFVAPSARGPLSNANVISGGNERRRNGRYYGMVPVKDQGPRMAGKNGTSIDLEKIPVTKIFGDTSFGVRMKKQDQQNERLDQIGLRLLDAARLRSDEINDIASAPHLFDSVKARINAERSCRESGGLSVCWKSFSGWRWQRIGAAFGVLALLLSGVIGWMIFTKQDSSAGTQENEPIDNPHTTRPNAEIHGSE